MKHIILIELNEAPFKVVDYFCSQRPGSTFRAVVERSSQFKTVCEDKVELDPWISWPTLHRGVNDEQHRIFRLGQITVEADARFPPIWRILADHGRRVGVFGSLHSNQTPRSMKGYDFYLPDLFDDQPFAHPNSLLPFQRFNLGMTRRSVRNVDTGVPWRLALELLRSAPKLGVSPDTIRSIARQLIAERLEPRRRIRRRSLQSELMGDVFLSLLKARAPDFATFFTNNVASAMHRYWNAAFPEDHRESPLSDRWRANYADEILEAMASFDRFLRRLKSWVDRCDDRVLLITSSMGQQAIDHTATAGGYTLRDMDRFMAAMGIERSQYRLRPAMSPCTGVVVDAAAQELLKAGLQQFSIGEMTFAASDQEVYPLSYGAYEGGFFGFFTYFEDFVGEATARIGERSFSLEEVGFGFLPHEDGVLDSGHHHEEGALLVYDPAAASVDDRRLTVSTTEIAPTLLDHFDVPAPAYMRRPNELVRAALGA